MGGLCAGIVGTVIGFPLDTIKTRMQTGTVPVGRMSTTTTTIPQQQRRTLWTVARSVFQQEGILSFYKGIGPPLLSLSILGTLTFTQYSYFQDRLYHFTPTTNNTNHHDHSHEDGSHGKGWNLLNFCAGVACSPVAGMISTVENLVKVKKPKPHNKRSRFS